MGGKCGRFGCHSHAKPVWGGDLDPLGSLKAEVGVSTRSISWAHKISCATHLLDLALSIGPRARLHVVLYTLGYQLCMVALEPLNHGSGSHR